MKYRDDMNDTDLSIFMKEIEAVDIAYADFNTGSLQIASEESEEFETEADLYRYWKP